MNPYRSFYLKKINVNKSKNALKSVTESNATTGRKIQSELDDFVIYSQKLQFSRYTGVMTQNNVERKGK